MVFAVFFVSGIIKGFLGIGLPAAAMAFLTLMIDPRTAISLMVLPILFTNTLQYLRAPNPRDTAREYWLFAAAIMVSIFITSLYIKSFPTAMLTVAIGFAMVVFSLQLLLGIKIPVTGAPLWQVGVGLFSGVLGGLSFYLVAARGDVFAGPQCRERKIYQRYWLFVSGRMFATDRRAGFGWRGYPCKPSSIAVWFGSGSGRVQMRRVTSRAGLATPIPFGCIGRFSGNGNAVDHNWPALEGLLKNTILE